MYGVGFDMPFYKTFQISLCVCPARTLFKSGSDMTDILDMTIYKPQYIIPYPHF